MKSMHSTKILMAIIFVLYITTWVYSDNKNVEGNWRVTLTELGQEFILKISTQPDGTLTAATPDGIALDKVTFENGTLHLEGGSPTSTFKGTLTEDGLTIEGTLRQEGAEMPAVLKRIENTEIKSGGESDTDVAKASQEKLQDHRKLVAWWKLDNDVNDSAGTHHGSIHGAPRFEAGKLGQAIRLDGDDYVDCGNPDELNFGTGDWTLSAWLKTTQTGTDESDELMNRGTIFANGGDEAGGIRYSLVLNEPLLGRISLTTDDDKNKIQVTSQTALNDGNWHHVVGMRHANHLFLYVDGKLDRTSIIPTGYDLSGVSQHNLYIGVITDNRDNSLYKHFIGLIDEVCVFKCALDANSVSALYSGKDPMTVAEQAKAVPARPPQAIDDDTAKKIVGDWNATLEKLNQSFVIHISKNTDGLLTADAIFEISDGEMMTLIFDKVTFADDRLHLEARSVQAIFEGTIKDDGLTIEGPWQQQGKTVTLILKRAMKAEETKRISQEQFPDRKSDKSNIATTLILIFVLVGVVAVVILFIVKSSIRS